MGPELAQLLAERSHAAVRQVGTPLGGVERAWQAPNLARLVAGQTVWCPYWSRDAAASLGSNRSDALEFTIRP